MKKILVVLAFSTLGLMGCEDVANALFGSNGPGESCETSDDCSRGLICGEADADGVMVCEADPNALGEGETCEDDSVCAYGLDCLGDVDAMTCQSNGEAGSPCNDDADCDTASGLSCDVSNGICTGGDEPATGETCPTVGELSGCETGETCVANGDETNSCQAICDAYFCMVENSTPGLLCENDPQYEDYNQCFDPQVFDDCAEVEGHQADANGPVVVLAEREAVAELGSCGGSSEIKAYFLVVYAPAGLSSSLYTEVIKDLTVTGNLTYSDGSAVVPTVSQDQETVEDVRELLKGTVLPDTFNPEDFYTITYNLCVTGDDDTSVIVIEDTTGAQSNGICVSHATATE